MSKQFSQELAQKIMAELAGMLDEMAANAQELRGMLAGPITGAQLTTLVEGACRLSRRHAARAHRLKMAHDWSVPPQPEWFDHFCDLYYQFRDLRASLWLERGVYGVLALKRQGRCLELCCGDGFNTFHFYSPLVAEMVAVDFDPAALAHARADNAHPSINYVQADIRAWAPEGRFDNVVWDAAIEHFTETEIAAIMSMIRAAMAEGAVLSGYTLIESGHGKALEHHEREFRSKQDLADFLTPHFRNVTVFETIHPTRHNLYFYASDAAIPFHPDWPHALQITR